MDKSDSLEIKHLNKFEIKKAGAHYTPRILANFVAKKIIESWIPPQDTEIVRVIDPAVGDGNLLLSLVYQLMKKTSFKIETIGFDTDKFALEYAGDRLQKQSHGINSSWLNEDFLNYVLEQNFFLSDPLFSKKRQDETFDLLIANPPYIRTQNLGAQKTKQLAEQFGLSGRIDIYHAFLLAISEVLKPKGIAGVIVSNRFLTTQAGKAVRKGLLEKYDILKIWDLGDTKIFEAAVLPAVLIFKLKNDTERIEPTKFTSIYAADIAVNDCKIIKNPIEALENEGLVAIEDGKVFNVRKGRLNWGEYYGDIWRLSNKKTDEWLEKVAQNTYCYFKDINKVRVGVKTTADKVFISNEWDYIADDQCPELLLPLTTHHIARRFKSIKPKHQYKILYTHEVIKGKRVAIDLKRYPNSLKYLQQYQEQLESRKYLKEAGRNWYEIWVPQNPNAWPKPKLVFKDISERPIFWIDLEGTVINGDCYWIAGEEDSIHLLWLALAVANSSFIITYYDYSFNNKLYASRRRFITQYVEKFPLPNPNSDIAQDLIKLSMETYKNIDSIDTSSIQNDLDMLVWNAFGF